MFIYCLHCGKQLKFINTKPTKVGNWSELRKYRTRAGLCTSCGSGHWRGKMHISPDKKHYVITINCEHCGHQMGWQEL